MFHKGMKCIRDTSGVEMPTVEVCRVSTLFSVWYNFFIVIVNLFNSNNSVAN